MDSPLRVGITYDVRSDYTLKDGQPSDYYDEFDSPETVEAVIDAIRDIGHTPVPIGNIYDLIEFVSTDQNVDLVFNFAEGLYGRSRESQVPALLEAYQIPYAGADALCLGITLDKPMTKRLLQHAGVPTPEFFVMTSPEQAKDAASALGEWPLFVKPTREGTSKGIGEDAIVHSVTQLQEVATRLIDVYKQPVMVEQFLPGTEYTVAIIEENGVPCVTNAQPINIGTAIFDNARKMQNRDTPFMLVREPELRKKLFDMSLAAYQAVECVDLARVDIRCNEEGEPEVMEINPLPHLHPVHSSYMYLCKEAGYTFETVIETIINNAYQRWNVKPLLRRHHG